MEQWLYVMQLEKTKTYNKLTKAVVVSHVEHIRQLDDAGQLALCGVYKGYPGVAGMYLLKAPSLEAAKALCQQEPLVAGGFATYQLHALQVANRENNYLL